MYILKIISWILFVLACVWWVHFLDKKNKLPNRWLSGFLAFLIVLIPSVMFPTLPIFLKQILYLLCGCFTIMFFETSRLKLERGEYRGIVKPGAFERDEK